MSTIEIGGLNEDDFRRSIENRLREGNPDAALERLRSLLAPYAGPDGLLPERFLTVEAAELELRGWDALRNAIRRRDQPGRLITAMSIAFAWPGEDAPGPDEEGRLRPHIETSFFSDNAYPFSQSRREDLLDGYSFYGSTWSGDAEAVDTVLSLEGIDDLHGALAGLESALLAAEEPDEDGIRAGSLGACLLSVLLVQAVGERIARDGLPRPLCVMAGSNDVYPYFDAPVAGMPEDEIVDIDAAEDALVAAHGGAPPPRYSSLLITKISHAPKRAVLVLAESEDETARRVSRLRALGGMAAEDSAPSGEEAAAVLAAAAAEPVPAAACNSPLLAKKPHRTGEDHRAPPQNAADFPHVLPNLDVAPALASDKDDPGKVLLAEPVTGPCENERQSFVADAFAPAAMPPTEPQWGEAECAEAEVEAVAAAPEVAVTPVPGRPGRPASALQELRAKATARSAAHPSVVLRMGLWLQGRVRTLIGRFKG